MVRAVLFDLDDTLYPQRAFLEGAWDAVADGAAELGVERAALVRALRSIAAEGSDRGRIIDRALERVGATGVDVAPLVRAFKSHAPTELPLYPGVLSGLRILRPRVALGLVSDGDVGIQQRKLDALGIADLFDVVMFSDALGREFRKPHRAPFEAALDALGVTAAEAVFVGDRPSKDVVGPVAVGMRPVRVRTGEWAAAPDEPGTWASVDDAAVAIAMIVPYCNAQPSSRKLRPAVSSSISS